MTQITRAQKGALMAAALVLAASAGAQAAPNEAGRAQVLQAVIDCRALTDTSARLSCYDAATARLNEAEAKGDVVVLDRAQTRAARREAFGFNMPSLNIFSRGEAPEELERASFKVTRAWRGADGKWALELDNGAVWRQTDTDELFKKPKAGSTVEIRTASLGSFFMNIDGQRAIRARREK